MPVIAAPLVVGDPPSTGWTYNGDPTSSDIAAVRFEIQDTDTTAPLLQDLEIAYAILRETGNTADTDELVLDERDVFASAARCMEALSERFGAQADTEIGALKVTYTTQANQYATRAKEKRAKAQGMQSPWSGGQSHAAKRAYRENSDQVQPKFTKDEFDIRNGRGRPDRGLLP